MATYLNINKQISNWKKIPCPLLKRKVICKAIGINWQDYHIAENYHKYNKIFKLGSVETLEDKIELKKLAELKKIEKSKGKSESIDLKKKKIRKKIHQVQKLRKFVEKEEQIKRNKRKQYAAVRKLKYPKHEISIKSRLKSFQKKAPFSKEILFEDIINKFGFATECYLSGETIDLKETATYHFDHIIPVSRGGSGDIENLGILSSQINIAKGTMTKEEFIEMCKKITDFNSNKK